MTPADNPRFEDLTETTGIPVSAEAAEMMYTRYHVAAELASARRVLELGCGAGQGFGLLSRRARSLVGGDYSLPLLRLGQRHYAGRFPLVQLSAHQLPFRPAAFDLVLCFEASYYVPDMTVGFREIARVLAPAGTVMFVNANPERPDFIRSPYSVHYHTSDEFRSGLEAAGFQVETAAAFPTDPPDRSPLGSVRRLAVGAARRTLETLHLVPRTLRGRARLKRLAYGRLLEVPPELPEGFAAVAQRTPVGPGPVHHFKVLYIRATRA